MQTAKIYIWLIGVAVLSAPIFYAQPVLAQNSQQGNLVLEVQQLREEIAELRGMIERQQYEIRQLKQGKESTSRSNTSPSVSPRSAPASGTSTSNPAFDQAESIESNGSQSSDSRPQPSEPAPTRDSSEQFYRATQGDEQFPETNPEVVSAARQARQAAEAYPPVVDRSLGGAAPTLSSPPVVDRSFGGRAPTEQQPSATQAAQTTTANSAAESTPIDAGRPVTAPPTTRPEQADPSNEGGVIRIPSETQPAQLVVTRPAAPVISEDEYYNQGFELLKQFKYPEAVNIFKQQIKQYPTGGFADDAHYWIAESMYLNRNLPESKQYFRAIINDFAQSPRLPDAMLKTAYIEQEQGNEIEARILLQEIIQYHPRSDAAISAKNRLEKLN